MVRCKRMALSQALASLKSASTATSMPALKLFALGKYSMGCSIISKFSVWVIFGHPAKRTHMVVSDSTRTTRTGTPSRNRSFVRCKSSMFQKSSKKFRMSMFDYTELSSIRVYVRRWSDSGENRCHFYILVYLHQRPRLFLRPPFESNVLLHLTCFTLFSSSQYFITVLTINTGRIYSLFLIRQCQISVVAFR